MHQRYYGLVRQEGNRRLVEFPDAPGCQTFVEEGEELLAVATEALQGWVEAMVASGQALPEETANVVRVVVEVPDGEGK